MPKTKFISTRYLNPVYYLNTRMSIGGTIWPVGTVLRTVLESELSVQGELPNNFPCTVMRGQLQTTKPTGPGTRIAPAPAYVPLAQEAQLKPKQAKRHVTKRAPRKVAAKRKKS